MQKSKMHVLIRYQIASSDVNNITPQTREALMAEGQFRRDDLLRQVNDDIKRSTSKLPSSRFLQINSNSIYKTNEYLPNKTLHKHHYQNVFLKRRYRLQERRPIQGHQQR